MKKLVLGTVLLGSLLLAGCVNNAPKGATSSSSSATNEKIIAAGSTALQPLVDAAKETYKEGENITVQGGGSGLGLSQVQSKAITIGNSDLFAEEKKIEDKNLLDHKVAVVGVAPVVNKDAGVSNLTKEQLKDIFAGKVKNWKEVGGKDQEIQVINRAEGSGTRFNFEKYALDNIQVVKSQEQDSSGTVKQIVTTTPGAISYLAFSYFDKTITALSVDGVEPKEENVQDNKWKIWSYEHMYTNGKNDSAEKFIDYILSDEVQNGPVKELGYLPVADMKVERDANGVVTEK
ncbi:phosphate transport system substrate-binding protein [Pilibacter termitis]|uniref:Phosphate-binding protein n=1 Tax=Pilibacter termitis TaxID=263852 RepID=A0A1T4KM55_9ENTE|nr:phosphate ABC transporter substrate-binding protein PstS family protein [Pilibacter termitis]SJZ43468.1 phosphate transport system substrate-binding protein [Pilibacter termitis]